MPTSSSEFYTIGLSTNPVPLDLSGAIQVLMMAEGADIRIQNHRNSSDGNYFKILKSDAPNLVQMGPIWSSDSRLFVRADSGGAVLYVWVVK